MGVTGGGSQGDGVIGCWASRSRLASSPHVLGPTTRHLSPVTHQMLRQELRLQGVAGVIAGELFGQVGVAVGDGRVDGAVLGDGGVDPLRGGLVQAQGVVGLAEFDPVKALCANVLAAIP